MNQLIGVMGDLRTPVVDLFFDKEWESKKDIVFEKIKGKLDALAKFIGNKEFALGYLTLADFYIAETSNFIEKVYSDKTKHYPFLQRIRDNFNNLPAIQKYYKLDSAMKGPFFPKSSAVIHI